MSATELAQRYQLLEPIGSGGQGRTYRGRDRQTGQEVAIKVIRLGEGGWKGFDLFERECRILRTLDHPAIPRYLDTFAIEEEGRYFLVMELVEGTPLHQLIAEGQPLAEAPLWDLLDQALGVLEYLHSLHPPVIHRDIKPANLIRRPDGRLALVDFGGVRLALRPEGGSTMIGSFGYMAPEQLHGQALPATDLYALGATLAALSAGVEADQLPRQGLHVDLPAVMASSPLRDLLAQLLEPDPTRRPASVAEVRELLRDHQPRRQQVEGPDEPPNQTADVMVRLFATFGYVGLVLLEGILLPLVYLMLAQAWGRHPDKLRKLEARREQVRGALRRGRRNMKQLARTGQPASRELPPGRSSPALPPRRDRHWRREERRRQREARRGRR